MQSHLQRNAIFAAACLLLPLSVSAHMHFSAGVIDANHNGAADPGEQLQLLNPPASGLIFHLEARPIGGRYGGYYTLDELPRTNFPTDYFTFTAAAATDDFGGPEPGHAALGSYIVMEITSVAGPSGGHFGFWEENRSFSHATPTVSFLTGAPTNQYRFSLSEGFDAPGEDPYGHIHNRAWSVDIPGTYTIGFTLVDTSHQGPGGGPVHTASQTYYYTFQAVPEPNSAALLAVGAGGLACVRRRRR